MSNKISFFTAYSNYQCINKQHKKMEGMDRGAGGGGMDKGRS